MKTTVALFVVGLCALAIATPTPQVSQYERQYKVADKKLLQKQKDLLRLFKHVFQSNYYKDQAEIAHTYKIEENIDIYSNHGDIREFLQYEKEGLLPRGEVFSIFNKEHRQQAVALFHVLYYAVDWETFYKTACWAREYVNEGIFVYAMHVAVFHRHDCQGMALPPIYEIYPYFFVNSEVIEEAYKYKMKYGGNYKNQTEDKEEKYYVYANYSGWYANPEVYDMSYFTEDVGMNAYYYYFHLDYPFWMNSEKYGLKKNRRGELYYFVHQQLLARFHMERLSNDYGSVHMFDWEEPIKTSYMPSMRYPNGVEFPTRPAYAYLGYNPHNQAFNFNGEDNKLLMQEIEDYERRIRDAIAFGYIFNENGEKIYLYNADGFDYLAKIIESNPDSLNHRFYGYLQVIAHQVLGYSAHPTHKYKVHASALEHFETALRDPIFYQFYKRITYYFLQYKNHLPPYTNSQLYYYAVKVESVHVDKLVTYFDKFDFEITNVLHVNEQEFEHDNFQVWARQERLTHQPFTYKINVQSDYAHDVVVRVFLGPKYDERGHEIPLNENRVNFFELDKFVYTLQRGKTVIERNSQQGDFVKDRTTYRAFYQEVMSALDGKQEFHVDMSKVHNCYPNRFMLPKGKVSGQVYQFYVYVSLYLQFFEYEEDFKYRYRTFAGERSIDNEDFGFPFDRPILDEHNFFVSNSYVEDVVIFHKQENEINTADDDHLHH